MIAPRYITWTGYVMLGSGLILFAVRDYGMAFIAVSFGLILLVKGLST